MPFDPNLPQESTLVDAVQMRGQLNGLKDLIDLLQSINAAQVDGVTTGNPGDPAAVTITVNGTTLHFNITLPRGDEGLPGIQGIPGNDGAPGEVTNAALAAAISGTSNNTNAVATMDTAFGNDPPTLADMELMRAKMNEMILAARR